MTANRSAMIISTVLIAVAFVVLWGGAVPAATAQTIKVTSADPPSGEQGSLNLNVRITGSGFKSGAKAKFYRTGTTDPGGIMVKSTTYKSDTELEASIDIADGATLSKFDIVVMVGSRTGKGTELFSVTSKRTACVIPDMLPSLSSNISGEPGYHGYLDSTFGNGTGKIILPLNMELGGGEIAIDGEGRIILLGAITDPCVNNSSKVFIVARYLPDGRLDSSFGTNGFVTPPLGVYAVAIDGDNKIVIVGKAALPKRRGSVPAVARLNVDGSLDMSFGGTGMVFMMFFEGYQAYSNAVTFQKDGKILVAGDRYIWPTGRVFVSRFNADGTLDTSFNGAGYNVYEPVRSTSTAIATQLIGSEERIVVVGYITDAANGGYWSGGVWRFTASGEIDSTFGSSGVVVTDFFGGEETYQGVVISGDRIIAAGHASGPASPNPSYSVVLAAYDQSGRFDQSFGNGGKVVVESNLHNTVYSIAIQGDGRLVVAGASHGDSPDVYNIRVASLWRFLPDGSSDPTFGNNGWVSDPIADAATIPNCYGLALHADGRIVWSGLKSNNGISYTVLARFWP